ncbi:uncharacterized protein SPSK_04644 [Sporothrix schenckii 1099-18]|uniref:Uncharacterized protein n=1 Tax=Sporothrix schenckii 1099-18 TaxID=1397361 RepID=A0A0F2M100_SPOSC|nr:uncharacterized protein SPSK_04644 [Sporothrix schenckii 1099-18]KJR83388.1 hypothetical protein SPSK_04644 [Sporothrix schenckii 1099-18]
MVASVQRVANANARFDAVLTIVLSNDTGSTLQTLTPMDVAALGVDPDSLANEVFVTTAAGIVPLKTMSITMQMLRPNLPWNPMTRWFSEVAVINPQATERLSGLEMRNHLYFATAPGNRMLYVSSTKTALRDILPAGSG